MQENSLDMLLSNISMLDKWGVNKIRPFFLPKLLKTLSRPFTSMYFERLLLGSLYQASPNSLAILRVSMRLFFVKFCISFTSNSGNASLRLALVVFVKSFILIKELNIAHLESTKIALIGTNPAMNKKNCIIFVIKNDICCF